MNPTTKLGPWTMLPARPGTCPECAVKHPPDQPHNAQSLFYQYTFFAREGRWPTWADALAHCAPDLAAEWRRHLLAAGVPADKLTPAATPTAVRKGGAA